LEKLKKEEVLKKIDEMGLSWYNSYFWKYQYQLALDYIIPYLKSLGIRIAGKAICEIGSAEGGVLFAFAQESAEVCLATDIAESRLQAGKRIADEFAFNIDFQRHDILNDPIPPNWQGKFDLVLLRDVIEHLDNPSLALRRISELLNDDGYLYVTFPPYYSPFGGHQHQLGNFASKIPYIHWLPRKLFHLVIKNGRPADAEEVRRLKSINLTIKKFMDIVSKNGFEIVDERYFLIRPVYKYKFGLNSVEIPRFINFNLAKEIFASEASYLLKKKRKYGN
jgi:SAM-dependent methyltransferase